MVKKQYTKQEWEEREDYYQKELLKLDSATVGQTTNDVLERLSKLDTLSTIAMFDFMQVERVYERATLDMKNAETEMFTTIKMEQISNGIKVTEADVKGLVKAYLKSNNLPQYHAPIYEVVKAAMHRHSFMKAVVEEIKNKRSSIISSLSLLKIESSLSPATQDIN